MAKVLIIDDEEPICDLIKIYLGREDFQVFSAYDGLEGLRKARELKPDLIILDILLPEIDGWEVCRALRKQTDVPIIMLSAKGEEIDKVLGLELGADDYVTKPFSPRELLSRVKAVLRRAKLKPEAPVVLEYPGLQINQTTREIRVGGEKVEFTPKEFDILWLLASHPEKVYTRQQILEQIWGYREPFCDERTVDQHVRRIRKKLQPNPSLSFALETVWGLGYKFQVKK